MRKNWTLKDAFGHFGAVAKNPRWSWSARSADAKTVVLTWWTDETRYDGDRLIFDMVNHPRLDIWRGRKGNRDRIRNLKLARDNCDGLFRIVWCKARDTKADVREATERWPDNDLRMRLTFLDENTGEFRAEAAES